ncbi:amidohydrolase family protein [Vacuolonema iberomarrocanum]|uniref:amidohydrolase family protein n=1 Tax=Vacuolonema iberomarrocanum TaxID=3454632 RepID=UPI001A0CE4C4|nr:amidohydrolase family protein [filamentous cyanobacterium LEGE 07170]
MTLFIRNARVLTLDNQDTEFPCADILIEGSQIRAIAPNLPVPEPQPDLQIIDARGMLAMPGLVNAHLHSPGNLMKGMLDGMPLEVFMLYEVPPLSDKPPSPRLNYIRTLLGCLEMLKLGITTVHDDAFYIPIPTPDTIDGLMQAYADSGMRVAAALDQPNVVEYEKYPYLYDLLPEELRQQMANAPRQSTEELLELNRYVLERWHGQCGDRLRAAVSCSAPQRVTPDYFAALSDLSRTYDLPFNVHILETKLQRVLGQEKYGKSLVQYVADLGLLDERMLVIHAIWVDDADMDRLAASGCSVAHNPVCNLRLGSGIMPFRALRDRGIPLCFGTDEACVDDTLNLWGVIKMAGLLHTLTQLDYRHWLKPQELLHTAIRGGARAMRLGQKIGVLAPGYEADVILLDLDTLAFTPLNDLRRQLVFCENGSSVRMAIVAGQVVMQEGHVLTVDEAAIKAEARELMQEYHANLEAVMQNANILEPYYRDMYLRAATQDVGMNRRAGYEA